MYMYMYMYVYVYVCMCIVYVYVYCVRVYVLCIVYRGHTDRSTEGWMDRWFYSYLLFLTSDESSGARICRQLYYGVTFCVSVCVT